MTVLRAGRVNIFSIKIFLRCAARKEKKMEKKRRRKKEEESIHGSAQGVVKFQRLPA